jgi:hypothetical protein
LNLLWRKEGGTKKHGTNNTIISSTIRRDNSRHEIRFTSSISRSRSILVRSEVTEAGYELVSF